MIPAGQLTGAVLAGGESRRMGRDKAGLVVQQDPLWRRQVKLLRDAGATAVGVVRRPAQAALPLPKEVALWCDTVAGAGPLAGLHAALASCRTGWLAVVAVDLPRLDASWFQWLAGFCAAGRGAIARRSDGGFEPLAAIYPRLALDEATAQLRGPDFSLQTLAAGLVARQQLASIPLPDAELWRVENWNTPADAALNAAGPASASQSARPAPGAATSAASHS